MKNFFKVATIIFLFLHAFANETFAQRSTGINNINPSGNAALDVMNASSYPQGILIPRLPGSDTSIIKLRIKAADKGLMFFDNVSDVFQYWNGTRWMSLGGRGTPCACNQIRPLMIGIAYCTSTSGKLNFRSKSVPQAVAKRSSLPIY